MRILDPDVECHLLSFNQLLVVLPWPKKIETGTQAKHRRVHARQITRLCHVRAVVSNFLGQGSICHILLTVGE